MRYSFHGKVRATGQQVDGFVEAATSTEAIDRLADQGIIGVYSVRAEPKPPKNAVILAGQPEPEPEIARLPAPTAALIQPPAPVYVPAVGSDAVLAQLMDKVSLLVLQVEKLLARPSQVIYSSGPAREGGGKKKASRQVTEAQDSTLRDIFQNNLDLRRSLDKLATSVGPTSVGTNGVGTNGARPKENGSHEKMPNMRDAALAANGRELQSQPAA